MFTGRGREELVQGSWGASRELPFAKALGALMKSQEPSRRAGGSQGWGKCLYTLSDSAVFIRMISEPQVGGLHSLAKTVRLPEDFLSAWHHVRHWVLKLGPTHSLWGDKTRDHSFRATIVRLGLLAVWGYISQQWTLVPQLGMHDYQNTDSLNSEI